MQKQIIAITFDVQVLQTKGVLQIGDTGTRKDGKTSPAEEQRRDKDAKAINDPGVQSTMVQKPAPFKKDALDAARAELTHGINQVDRAGTTGDAENLDLL